MFTFLFSFLNKLNFLVLVIIKFFGLNIFTCLEISLRFLLVDKSIILK